MKPQSTVVLALATRRFPHSSIPVPGITAIIKLTPQRADELLNLMKEIAMLGTISSSVFKISSFEPSAIYAPTDALTARPLPDDFVVLEPGFSVARLSQVKVIQASVLPHHVSWEAYDVQNRYKLTTPEVDCRVLQAIASEQPIAPGATSATFSTGYKSPSIPVLLNLPKYSLPLR